MSLRMCSVCGLTEGTPVPLIADGKRWDDQSMPLFIRHCYKNGGELQPVCEVCVHALNKAARGLGLEVRVFFIEKTLWHLHHRNGKPPPPADNLPSEDELRQKTRQLILNRQVFIVDDGRNHDSDDDEDGWEEDDRGRGDNGRDDNRDRRQRGREHWGNQRRHGRPRDHGRRYGGGRR